MIQGSTIREIRLHGALGAELGPVFRFHAASVAEAIRALCRMVKGARERIESGAYLVVREGERLARGLQGAGELRFRLSPDERVIHLIPRARGAKEGGIGKALLGAVLIVASFYIPGAGVFGASVVTGSTVAGLGVSMALSGLASFLSPRPKASGRQDQAEQERSTLYSDIQNVAAPGAPIPVVFGTCEVGSVVVSAAIHAEDRA